jgi:GTP-binding protein
MFIDELTIHLKAGKGGDGIVSWRHEKGKDLAGPGGGNGGDGGDVFIRAVSDIGKLAEYKFEKEFRAEDGLNGLNKGMKGGKGKDIIIDLPIGSVVKNLYTEDVFELLNKDEKILILKGGRGGLGNEHFKSSTNVAPKENTEGGAGEEADFFIELKMVVDLGLVGLPNAGKSSLINFITNSKSKVADYQFTTLFPHLGDLYGFIIADIPGLIEGASDGKGLGFKFLRHIERTKIILHLVDCSSADPKNDYKIIRKELKNYSDSLFKKQEFILLTKSDLVDKKTVDKLLKYFKTKAEKVWVISVIDDVSLKNFKDDILKTLRTMV